MKIGTRRQRLGEKLWKEYQQQQNVLKVIHWRRRTKLKLIEYKGGKCSKCGFDEDCPSAYHLHHRDKSQKEFGFSSKGKCRNWASLVKEADKCDLVCAICHARIHDLEHQESIEKTVQRIKQRITDILKNDPCYKE